MARNNMIRKATEEEATDVMARIRSWNDTYAMNMLQLQETAGLTYKEARAFLIPYRETPLSMALDLGIDIHAIYNLQRRAKNKIAVKGLTMEEIFGDYVPEEIGPILI